MYYSYILLLSDHTYYTGFSSDLKTRIKDHQIGNVPQTRKLRPLKLVYYSAFSTKKLALDFEKYLNAALGDIAENYQVKLEADSTPQRNFSVLINQLRKKTGKPVAILIDEYDAPLIKNISDEPREILKLIGYEIKELFDFEEVDERFKNNLEDVLKRGNNVCQIVVARIAL